MGSKQCNRFRKFLCKVIYNKNCVVSENTESTDKSDSEPVFVKNKSGRWIHRKTGRFVKKEVVEEYAHHNPC